MTDKSLTARLDTAFATLPLVAILRGLFQFAVSAGLVPPLSPSGATAP